MCAYSIVLKFNWNIKMSTTKKLIHIKIQDRSIKLICWKIYFDFWPISIHCTNCMAAFTIYVSVDYE